MTAEVISMSCYAKKPPVVATSDYLNRPVRPLALVISLREARQAAMPVSRPCDSEDGSAA